tara:strand:+ start:393 stop:974 length:582 start_codon:yes stop_codon:yes gene_type:complete
MINAPIPGQSLTGEPKSYPWENPPKIIKPLDAAIYHIGKLNKPKKITALLDMLELDVDMVTLVSGVLRMGVSDGIHTVDVSLLIAPVLHEFIKGHADRAGIDYNEGFEEEDMDRTDIEYSIKQNKSQKLLDKLSKEIKGTKEIPEGMGEGMGEGMDEGMDEVSESIDENINKDMPEVSEEMPQGLMARQGSAM